MAMGKNKTGIMAAITAAADASNNTAESKTRAQRTLPKGTIGSVRAGMGGIQEIDPALILAWGPKDRLGIELTAVNNDVPEPTIEELSESIKVSGQQVPVLLRPSENKDGYFEVVYGRRRILACRQLSISVKALIRTLDDTEALKAKGLENASRAELSYYERARFAKDILVQGFSRADVVEALAISKNTLSQLERITRLVPDTVGDLIGAAPKSGRPKWMSLADLFESGNLVEEDAVDVLSQNCTHYPSDERLGFLLKATGHDRLPQNSGLMREIAPGVTLKSSDNQFRVSVSKSGESHDFAIWLETHIGDLINESFERFQAEDPKG